MDTVLCTHIFLLFLERFFLYCTCLVYFLFYIRFESLTQINFRFNLSNIILLKLIITFCARHSTLKLPYLCVTLSREILLNKITAYGRNVFNTRQTIIKTSLCVTFRHVIRLIGRRIDKEIFSEEIFPRGVAFEKRIERFAQGQMSSLALLG